MSAVNAALLLGAGDDGYQISRSVRLRSSASAYFNRTPASSSGQQTFTISAWLKRGALSSQQVAFGINSASTNIFTVAFLSGDTFRVFGRNAGSDVLNLTTTAVYRDPSSWYHIVVAIDTTQATAANRARLYVNGVEVTAFGTATYPSQNTSLAWNSSSYAHDIGRESTGNYFDGYLTEINHISGSQLTPSSFGETDAVTGVWKPKKYAGTYGTNGFYLNFSDNSNNTAATIGKDYSGNGNNWTPNNISVTSGVTYDSMLDVPTQWADGGNGRGNYCVWNPLDKRVSGSSTFANGNLSATVGASGSTEEAFSTFAFPNSGKWYCEVTVSNIASGNARIGIANLAFSVDTRNANGYLYQQDGQKYVLGTASAYGSSWTTNDVIGVAFDADAGSITFYKNNTSQGAITGISTSAQWVFGSTGRASVLAANFGQQPFAYTPPTGFKALNTQNLPAPTILKGNQFFDATTWTGNGTSQSIVNSGAMQPDFVWVKDRTAAGTGHYLTDVLRGIGYMLQSDTTGAEVNRTAGSRVSAFNSNGFSVVHVLNTDTNANGDAYVGWQWKESATAGFDIVTYTGDGIAGRTVSHNLGVAPKLIMIKRRDSSAGWLVYTTAIDGSLDFLVLNTTAAKSDSAQSAPTSSVFSVSSDVSVNANGGTYVAYCFAEVAGFSRIGSYTGNGSTDGPFVFCGFRPRWILIKGSSTAGSGWAIIDAVREGYNVANDDLYADLSNAEASSNYLDITSNGFKLRSLAGDVNGSTRTYIFAAFAEHPFKNALAR